MSHAPIFYKNWIGTHKNWWINFPEIGPAHAPVIEISKKYWMSFPEIGLCHAPENWDFVKTSGWIFQTLPIKVMNHNLWWIKRLRLTHVEIKIEFSSMKTFLTFVIAMWNWSLWKWIMMKEILKQKFHMRRQTNYSQRHDILSLPNNCIPFAKYINWDVW